MLKGYLTIFLLVTLFLNFPTHLHAELILAEDNIGLLSCQKIYDRFFLLYSRNENTFGEIFVKEFDSNWRETQGERLGINGSSAYLAYFNNRFYVSYTSFEKEGNVHIAEFDLNWNLLRDILVTPTPYDGEIAYQLIPLDNGYLYLFYARNWQNDCGLKMVEFNPYLEAVKEFILMRGEIDFHANQASDFSTTFAMDRFYIAYKKSSPQEGMDIFVNEYNLSGELIQEICIDQKEKLSPSLFFDNERFYLAYEGYDNNINKHIIYICQYDINWSLLKKIRIVTQESGAPREKVIIVSEGKCYLVNISQGEKGESRIFLKEINFDLEEDRVRL